MSEVQATLYKSPLYQSENERIEKHIENVMISLQGYAKLYSFTCEEYDKIKGEYDTINKRYNHDRHHVVEKINRTKIKIKNLERYPI